MGINSKEFKNGYSNSIGTPGWDRTSGFQLRRLALYPLSYGRTIFGKISLSEC